jgi:aspartyl protease family protein
LSVGRISGAFLAALLAGVAASAAQATTVMVMSLEQDRAQLLVNGSGVRTLRAGQASPEGVRLLSADRSQAVIEVDGKPVTLKLGQSTVAAAELKADPRGQFVTTAYVNGVETRAMIDTGATSVALSSDEARRLGVSFAGLARIQIATAGGAQAAYRVNLASVRVGGVTLHNVDAVVLEGGREQLPLTLIGMSFLNGVDMRRVGDTLTLTRRNF